MNLNRVLKFGREVRAEAGRITWPKWAETRMLTIMVFILATLVGLFLLVVDVAIGAGLKALLGY